MTHSERVAIGEAVEDELRLQAEKRMKAGVHNPKENFPEGQEGQTRDLAAKAAGFGQVRDEVRTPCAREPGVLSG